ncbi:MAG: hypothetical protein A3G75_10750 [Verrucomicrobia bacterium RIFCSPLOWO2_12_FULL_64_8]|nr:MAG: hypothetical protein A3G75_10750 [Verrucomicrobia bacterium RIFCSPLOWO2_12_FULL_64_8]
MKTRTLVLLLASIVALPVARADRVGIIFRDTPPGPPIAARAYLHRADQSVGLEAFPDRTQFSNPG